MSTSQQYLKIAEEFAAELRKRVVSGIQSILLYGSVARGEAGENSDIDLLVVYKDESSDYRDRSIEVAADMMNKHNALISILDCNRSEYQRLLRFPFGWQITKEAIQL